MQRRTFLEIVPLLAAARAAAAVSLAGVDALPDPVKTVFTPDEIKSLNAFQRSRVRHPFTCCKHNRDADHLDGEGVLLATERGWVCLYCDYTQDWAHAWMKNWRWKEIHWRELEAMRRERAPKRAVAP
jgi:hypothetical protein